MSQANNANAIPFGFTFNGECFDAHGKYIDPPGKGLTCATFVISAFHSQSYKFIRLDEWLPSDANIPWQTSMIEAMKSKQVSEKHIEAVTKDLGAARFLPEEVGCAAERPHENWAIGRNEAQAFAAEMIALLNEAYPQPAAEKGRQGLP